MVLMFYFVIGFILLDLMVMKRLDPQRFADAFTFSPRKQIVYGVIFVLGLAVALFPRANVPAVIAFLTLYILLVYLISRNAFRKASAFLDNECAKPAPKLVLASESLEIVLHWFAWMLGFSLLLKLVGRVYPLSNSLMFETALFTILASVVMFVLIWRMTIRVGLNFQEVMGTRRNGRSMWQLFILPAFLGVGLAAASAAIMAVRSTAPPTPFGQMIESIDSLGVLMVFLTAAVILAPFFEEVIFRGFLFHMVEKLKNRRTAFITVATVFTLLHVDQYRGDGLAIAMVALLGITLTLLRTWTGSTIPGIVTHYCFNATMTIVPIIFLFFSNPAYFEYQIKFFRLDNIQKEQLLKKSLSVQPDHAPSLNDLAWVYAEENKNLDTALELADSALREDPDNYAFVDTKAEILFRMGRIEEAVTLERDLLKRNPRHPLLERQLKKFEAALPALPAG